MRHHPLFMPAVPYPRRGGVGEAGAVPAEYREKLGSMCRSNEPSPWGATDRSACCRGDQVGAKIDQTGAQIDQTGAKIGQVGAKMAYVGAKMGYVGTKMGQVGTKMAPRSAKMAPRWAKMDPRSAKMLAPR